MRVIDKLLTKINRLNCDQQLPIPIDLSLINKALYFIEAQHHGQVRHSGEPYYYHPIEVALIVTDYFFDTETIVAALLHDIIEDTNLSTNQIDFVFGAKIAFMVDKLSKIENSANLKLKLSTAESSSKLISTNQDDQKIFVIKVSDRLHNMRTIEYLPNKDKQQAIALETLQLFVPIARYINTNTIADELYNLAVAILKP